MMGLLKPPVKKDKSILCRISGGKIAGATFRSVFSHFRVWCMFNVD